MEENKQKENNAEDNAAISFVKETIRTIVTASIMTFFIYNFITTPNQVQGLSMMPNIQPNELILTNRFKHLMSETEFGRNSGWEYSRGEIIIFKQEGKEAYIKRIVALPGDEVTIKNNQLIVNGKLIHEDYIPDDVVTSPGTFIKNGEIVKVPENEFVAFGDNRPNSLDSRYVDVSFVKREDIIGRAELRISPLSKFGIIPVGKYEETEINSNEKIDLTNS